MREVRHDEALAGEPGRVACVGASCPTGESARPAPAPAIEAPSTREAWLVLAGAHTARLLARPVPLLHVSVGWPKSKPGRRHALGQCWDGSTSQDGAPHIFVSPELADPVTVLAVLVHEQIHAAVGSKCGHRGAFIREARAAGLVGPWTATTASPELAAKLAEIAAQVGPYPHAAIRAAEDAKKKGSRLRLWECGCEPPVKVRVASDDFAATCDVCNRPFKQPLPANPFGRPRMR